MITRPTVLVLGAGASRCYGFPLGAELYKNVVSPTVRFQLSDVEDCWSCRELYNAAKEVGTPLGEIVTFSKALQRSGVRSIDQFLAHRTNFLHIGKLAIAASLMPFEEPSGLHLPSSLATSWYHLLFDKLRGRTVEDFEKNALTVVTFNYDRSLEAFLYISLANLYGLSEEEALSLSQRVKIIRPHGSLGPLTPTSQSGRAYNSDRSAPRLREAIGGIIVLSEATEDSPEFKAAREALQHAERTIFLGFGYHDDTMERLQVRAIARKNPIGSCMGLTEQEMLAIQSRHSLKLQPASKSFDVLDFLRNSPDLAR